MLNNISNQIKESSSLTLELLKQAEEYFARKQKEYEVELKAAYEALEAAEDVP